MLDEMNLARVEYYFARFLSAMELRVLAKDRPSSSWGQAKKCI